MKNRNLNLAIIDDNGQTRILIKEKMEELYPDLNLQFDLFASAEEYLHSLSSTTYDLTFLDIEMPGMNGIQLAKKLNAEERMENIVYVSNREDLVFDSLETRPYGFVRKSNFPKDIKKVVDFFLQQREENADGDRLLIQSEGKSVSLMLQGVVFIESRKKNQIIHTKDGVDYVISSTMRELIDKLSPKGFIECCKGILVNASYISVIKEDSLCLEDGKVLPIARRKVSEVKEKYMEITKDHLTPIY